MRRLLISLMAASMLVPAAAHADDGGLLRGMRNHAERSNSRDNDSDNRSVRSQPVERSERSSDDRPARTERARRGDQPAGVDRAQRIERADGGDRGAQAIERVRRSDRDGQRAERVRRAGRDVRQVEQVQVQEPVQRKQTERRRDGLTGGFTQAGRGIADGRTNNGGNDRDDDRNWRRNRDSRHEWSRDWRSDRRYDWSNYRNRYGSLYRLGRYYDPYGWGYRRFSTGFSLWPSYYGSNYRLDDPWTYRLPPAYGPYRWVRYYDDAVLVNIHTGGVVDVIHNFFW